MPQHTTSPHTVHFRFEARQYQRLHRVTFMAPTLIWVRQGTKQMQTHGTPLRCEEGACLCLPACEAFEMENLPGLRDHYLADIFVPPRRWCERFLQHYAPALPDHWQAEPSFRCSPDLAQALQGVISSQSGRSPLAQAQTEHAWQGVLLTLAAQGLAAPMFNLQPLTLTQKVQTLLYLDLARPWQAQEVAQRLGMSESTLRRGLRQEESSFSELLSELRMNEAFSLVMTSEQPLLQVALECGFHSPSRFSQNFRQRYGMSPSALRQDRGLLNEELEAVTADL